MTTPGLCGRCRHARVVRNRRGSRFWLCGRAKYDARFRKYPVLPVLRCTGYDPGKPMDDSGAEEA